MIGDKSVLALVPARGGSKRLPGKNAMLLHGVPMMAYSVMAGCQSQYVDAVAVSTDDEGLAAIGRRYGAEVPFLRPPELAADDTTTMAVVVHAMQHYAQQSGRHFDVIVLLQPTSPLRTASHVDAALALFADRRAAAVVSVCETEHSPLWSNVLPPDGSLRGFLRPEVLNVRSQDLPRYYRLNGAVYAAAAETLLKQGSFFPADGAYAYVMEREDSVDVDNLMDFQLCELLLRSQEEEAQNGAGS